MVGVIGASGAQGTNAGTYRVTAVTDADTLVVERMDGASFDFATGTSLAWRLHPAAAADTGGSVAGVSVVLSGATGYVVPARPLAATVANATNLSPAVVPTAASATNWDPLSGLKLRTHPTGNGSSQSLIYDANVHAPNAANNSTLDARYIVAMDATRVDAAPSRDINIVVLSRKSSTLRAYLKGHVLVCSEEGLTRRGIGAPELDDVLASATAVSDSDPGVGANRSARYDYAWPGQRILVPEAIGFTLPCADGTNTTDGILDDSADFLLASVEANLVPERNPGQTTAPVPALMSGVLGMQRGVTALSRTDYIALRAAGVVALRDDRKAGWIFQSGVTTSLVSNQKNISTRRMSDYLQDSMAERLTDFNKQPGTPGLRDSAVAELVGWLTVLKSPGNPAAARIADFEVDDQSGNTAETLALGVYVIIVRVQLTPNTDFIVLQTEIGEGVRITELLAA